MTRRFTLLAALVLVACTADLPTEPDQYAGPVLGAALPPPPAPPQPLETTIQGGGPNVLEILGYYESPTLARVTISGVLTYSGLNAGYYPGETGTIDYQGRQIPGQCAMNVVVYIQGSGLIGGTHNCPPFWQGIGGYSALSIVSGQVMLGRNAAAPGACFYGGSPCATISGEQTVTVTPIDGNVKITVDNGSTYSGGLIVAKFTADPEWFEGKQVPFTLRSVTFNAPGGEPTPGCTTWHKPNECSFRLYQSGYLVVEAIVSGKLRTQRQPLEVFGSPLPPDTVPTDTIPTDTIPTDTIPTDTIPGGGGGGGGCSAGVPNGLSGVLAACEPEEDSIVIDVAISRPTVLPVIELSNFNAVTQVATRRGAAINRHDTVTVTVTARSLTDGAPKAGVPITLRATPVFPSGGHIHEVAPRPTGTFLRPGDDPRLPTAGSRGQINVTTDSTGSATVRYRSSGLGGVERLHALSPTALGGARPDSVALTIRYPGLVAMTRAVAGVYEYKDQDPNPAFPSQRHGNNNHWVRPLFRDSVLAVFADFYRRGGRFIGATTRTFVITDAGLEYGGLLESGDSNADEWRSPHLTHRTGNDMDIRSQEGGQPVWSNLSYERLIASCFPRPNRPGGKRVSRCDLEPPPVGNAPHLHIEGLP